MKKDRKAMTFFFVNMLWFGVINFSLCNEVLHELRLEEPYNSSLTLFFVLFPYAFFFLFLCYLTS